MGMWYNVINGNNPGKAGEEPTSLEGKTGFVIVGRRIMKDDAGKVHQRYLAYMGYDDRKLLFVIKNLQRDPNDYLDVLMSYERINQDDLPSTFRKCEEIAESYNN